MIEVTGNLWTYPADIRVITTNGFVKKNGEAVMGRGCALEAKQRHPTIARVLGDHLKKHGNHAAWLYGDKHGEIIWSFPVKHNWMEKADLDLIRRSVEELSGVVATGGYRTWVLPRPGCGNGQLSWEDVRPLCAFLPDNVHIITFPKRA